jgi:hypothetical protein
MGKIFTKKKYIIVIKSDIYKQNMERKGKFRIIDAIKVKNIILALALI